MIKSVRIFDDGLSVTYWVEYENGIIRIYDGLEVDLDEFVDGLTQVYSSIYCGMWRATYERR